MLANKVVKDIKKTEIRETKLKTKIKLTQDKLLHEVHKLR